MLGMNLEKHMEKLEEIAGAASKEFSLEKARASSSKPARHLPGTFSDPR